jgi:hypothetical protein
MLSSGRCPGAHKYAVRDADKDTDKDKDAGRRHALQQRVDPSVHNPEGRGHPERMSTGEHAGRVGMTGEQFPAQPTLAHSGLTRQQDDAELTRRGSRELIL